eukprot:Pgem_evm1s14074
MSMNVTELINIGRGKMCWGLLTLNCEPTVFIFLALPLVSSFGASLGNSDVKN